MPDAPTRKLVIEIENVIRKIKEEKNITEGREQGVAKDLSDVARKMA